MFKKITKVLCVLSAFTMINSVSALTLNNNDTYLNKQNAMITKSQYQVLKSEGYSDVRIDNMPQSTINGISAKNKDIIGTDEKYFAETTVTDRFGNIKSVRTLEITKEQSEKISKSRSLHILSDGKLHEVSNLKTLSFTEGSDQITTANKRLRIEYYGYQNENGKQMYHVHLWNEWLGKYNPKVKSYDLLGIRFVEKIKNTSSIVGFFGEQSTLNSNYYYVYNQNEGFANFKFLNNGVGLMQNLSDNARPYQEHLHIDSTEFLGHTVYGSYQHCVKSSLTNAQSKKYTFASDGLGNVFKHTYASSYDNMPGVTSKSHMY